MKREERYGLTFLGLLSIGHRDMEELQDQIELYLRRNGWNAIILTAPSTFEFHKVEYVPKKGALVPKKQLKGCKRRR